MAADPIEGSRPHHSGREQRAHPAPNTSSVGVGRAFVNNTFRIRTASYYAALLHFYEIVEQGYLRPEHRALIIVDKEPAEPMERLKQHQAPDAALVQARGDVGDPARPSGSASQRLSSPLRIRVHREEAGHDRLRGRDRSMHLSPDSVVEVEALRGRPRGRVAHSRGSGTGRVANVHTEFLPAPGGPD